MKTIIYRLMLPLLPFFVVCIGIFSACQKTEPTWKTETKNLLSKDIRNLSEGTIPDGYYLNATVISNSSLEDENIMYVQDSIGSGMKIRFSSPHRFNLRDSLQLYVSGATLEIVNGEYTITNIPLIYSNRVAAGSPTSMTTNASEVRSKGEEWSSSLVTLRAMKVIGQTDAETYLLKDSIGDATINVHVNTSLGIELPNSVRSISGILLYTSEGSLLKIRNSSDILTYSPIAGSQTILETFDVGGSSSMPNGDQVFSGFTSGDWMFNDAAVLGANEVNDLRNGAGTVRLRGNTTNARIGYIHTLFDVKGLQKIRFKFGGTNLGEGGSETQEYSVETFISTDGGTSWTSLGKKIGSKGVFTVMEYEVNGDSDENFRVKIQNTSFVRPDNSNRLRANVDDVELIY